jgi:hypothetical protein
VYLAGVIFVARFGIFGENLSMPKTSAAIDAKLDTFAYPSTIGKKLHP